LVLELAWLSGNGHVIFGQFKAAPLNSLYLHLSITYFQPPHPHQTSAAVNLFFTVSISFSAVKNVITQ
jgi:hypothetical protein